MAMEEDFKFSQIPNLKRSPDSSPSLGPNSTNARCTGDDDSSNGSNRSRRKPEERRQNALVACRNRRGAESGLIQDLGQALPVTSTVLKSCDKLAILRLATSYLKLRAVLERLDLQPGESNHSSEDAGEIESLLLRGGFVIIMSTDGEIVYVSDNAAEGLRCEKYTILGTNIYDHVDEDDYPELDRLLAVTMHDISRMSLSGSGTGYKTPQETATVHLRPGSSSILPASSRTRAPKRSGRGQRSVLEPLTTVTDPPVGQVRVTGKVFLSPGRQKTKTMGNFFVGVVEPLDFSISAKLPMLNPLDSEFPFPQFEVSVILDWVCTADMRVVSFDLKKGPPPDRGPDDMAGMSVFDFIHAEDMAGLRDGLKSMYKHGSFQTRQAYRMLAQGGGWAWFMTQASTMEVEDRDRKGSKRPVKTTTTFCVGRHFMISDLFQPGQPLATVQMSLEGSKVPESEPEPEPSPVLALEPESEAATVLPLPDCDFLDPEFFDFENMQPGFSAGDGDVGDVDWLLEELDALAEADGLDPSPAPAAADPAFESSQLLRFLLEPAAPSSVSGLKS